jgi:hypothetical protein
MLLMMTVFSVIPEGRAPANPRSRPTVGFAVRGHRLRNAFRPKATLVSLRREQTVPLLRAAIID